MTGKHILEGLIKWSSRELWADRFEEILEDHLLPTCDETGLEMDDIVSTLGEGLFMSTVWACAFEDFLTREFDGGENAIDDYLKRRGWKETASVRSYMAALRNSTMSLYEVSEIVPGKSFRARDLIRGDEPILVSERSATRSLKPWDRIAARVVQMGTKMQIGGGVLVFEHGTAENILEAWDAFGKLGKDERRKFAENVLGKDFDDEVIADLSPIEMLRTSRAGTTSNDIRSVLQAHDEFCMANTTTWNWITREKQAAAAGAGEQPGRSLNFETWRDDGALVLGDVTLEDKAVVLSVNSRQRCDRGDALMSRILSSRVGKPSIKTETIEQMMASRDAAEPQAVEISEEEKCAVIHEQMDRHYRSVLDEPVPALGGVTPRAAVKTDSGRIKVAEWLKMMENSTAKSGDHNSAMASYNFGWLWKELGLAKLRR